MREADVYLYGRPVGVFREVVPQQQYVFAYQGYQGVPISLTMPTSQQVYIFEGFPAFFEGLLPEGYQLDALLKQSKIDRYDLFSQLMAVGHDVVGAVTITERVSDG